MIQALGSLSGMVEELPRNQNLRVCLEELRRRRGDRGPCHLANDSKGLGRTVKRLKTASRPCLGATLALLSYALCFTDFNIPCSHRIRHRSRCVHRQYQEIFGTFPGSKKHPPSPKSEHAIKLLCLIFILIDCVHRNEISCHSSKHSLEPTVRLMCTRDGADTHQRIDQRFHKWSS